MWSPSPAVARPPRPLVPAPPSCIAVALRSEPLILVALFALALAIRWPSYQEVPTYTDEVHDSFRAAEIAQGRVLPLTSFDFYNGPLFNYLEAGLLVAVGPYVELPRTLVLVLGSLAVPATYLLGRAWGGRHAGLLTAALLAANSVHVLVNSRVAWSNSTTPLFTTLALWALSRSVGAWHRLPLAGLLLGLALQTHPSVLGLLPACAIFVIWKAPALLRTRWPWLAVGAFLVGYGPMVLANVLSRFELLGALQRSRSLDPTARGFGPGIYVENLANYTLLLLRTLGGDVERGGGVWAQLLDPFVWVWLVPGAVALVWLAGRGNPLPLLAVASWLLVSGRFSSVSFEPIFNGRYVMPMTVVLEAAVAALLVSLLGRAQAAWSRVALGVGIAALALQPLIGLTTFRDERVIDNRGVLSGLAAIEAERRPDEVVVLDRALANRHGPDGAKVGDVIETMLMIRRVPYRYADLEPDDVRALLTRAPSQLVVLDADDVSRLRNRFALTRLAVLNQRLSAEDPRQPAVYRIDPRG